MKLHVGCSSFRERNWKGIFYPDDLPQSRYFEYYCRHFDTYEMNGTFYRFPTEGQMEKWYGDAPEHFLYSVKAPRWLTHIKKMKGCQEELAGFYRAVSALGEKLAMLLFQFPPQYDFSPERLAHLTTLISRDYRHVFEFRHVSWWREEVFAALQQAGVSFWGVSYPKLDAWPVLTSPVLYYRFHGNRSLFRSSYSDDELRAFADAVAGLGPDAAFVYFNNTATAAGIENALKLKSML